VPSAPNAMRWSGAPGHYEVWYVSLTDRGSGCGAWLRFTLLAPAAERSDAPTCALWLMAMDPADPSANLGRKRTFPIAELRATAAPFGLELAGASLSDHGSTGAFDDVRWDLRWTPTLGAYHHVHPLLSAVGAARTELVLPHPDLAIEGTLELRGRTLELAGTRGGQAHLWGSKHARRWAWAHCNDFESAGGGRAAETFIDGVSVVVPRLGREVGPSTPVVGRVLGRDLESISPLRVLANASRFTATSWSFTARAGDLRVTGEVDARRDDLVGVTYEDPDGERAYCYNSEVATMRLHVWERPRRAAAWSLRETLVAPGRAHFEFAQREPLPDLPLLVA